MRYAIYFAPPPSTLFHTLGSHWLGRDAITDETLTPPAVPGLAAVTDEPRRYGFHATLKPPFALRAEADADRLANAMVALAAAEKSFRVALKPDVLDGFLALVPERASQDLDALAARCVAELDHLRRPADAGETAKRRAAGLTDRQEINLQRWGYPYVFEDFRFHMTLTGRLPPAEQPRFLAAAAAHFAPVLAQPVEIGSVTLFQEAADGAPFLVTHRFPFPAPSAEALT